jgi:protein tyrosine/serine phosphatase
MGMVSLLLILAFALQSGPEQGGTPTNEVEASNNGSVVLTAPSAFPNIKIKNFGQMDQYFYRGAQPEADDYKALAALGIKTIIDLRDDPTKYEKAGAEAASIRYVNIPMSDKRKPTEDQIAAFLEVAKDPSNAPFYVHCVGGRHRTGLIGAIYRYKNYGWDFDQVYHEMKNYDYYSRWGHGAIKEYVQEYYEKMKLLEPVSTATLVTADASESEPATPPPAPKFKE